MPLHKIRRILSYAETEQTFFARVQKYHSGFSAEYRMIERAYDNALHAFSEVYRDAGQPYFVHVRAVAIILMDYLHIYERTDLKIAPHKIVVATLLHDNPEDRPDMWPLSRIARDFDDEVAMLVDYTSKRPKSFFDNDEKKQLTFYHQRFPTAPLEFFLIKLADRLHNQLTLWSCNEQKIRRKMQETEEIYLPWSRKKGILAHELEATTRNFERRLQKHMRTCAIVSP